MVKSILLVKTSSLGDVIHALPAISDIRSVSAGVRVDWVVEEPLSAVPLLHSGVTNVIPVAIRRWRSATWQRGIRSEIAAFLRRLREDRYDAIIDAQGLFKSAMVALAARGTRYGLDFHSSREPLALFYHRTHRISWHLHAVERNRLLLARALNYEVPVRCDYGISSAVERFDWLAAGRYVVLLHATSGDYKLWPESNWGALVGVLNAAGMNCVLPWGSAGEHERSRRIAASSRAAIVPPALSLTDLAGLFAGARAVVGVDTGLTHLAAALGVPTVGIYCATDPAATGLYGCARAVNLGGIGEMPDLAQVAAAVEKLGRMIKSRFGYTLVLYALLPYALLHLLWRGLRQRAYLRHVAERFGNYTFAARQPLIWVHAVSVGETRAAQPLIQALQRTYPRHHILLTHTTPTGREAGELLFGDRVARCYLPYDLPFGVARFLDFFKPVCGILVDTEIWPNLVHACRVRNVPLHLVNARLSEKSFRGYRRFGALAAATLNELAGISAQSDADAVRFRTLGAAAVVVAGNIKFDVAPDASLIARGRGWREAVGRLRPVVLAASTRAGEETLLLEAMRERDVPGLLLVIVPRHPQRFDEVAALLTSAGLTFQRRSDDQPVAATTRVWLGDSMGEMIAYYAACDVAIIGGSLLPFGAQNLIEACAVGTPVIIGPHTYNFAEATQLAVDAGAALQVYDARGALAAARELLADPARAQRMAHAGEHFTRLHRGATERTIAMLRF